MGGVWPLPQIHSKHLSYEPDAKYLIFLNGAILTTVSSLSATLNELRFWPDYIFQIFLLCVLLSMLTVNLAESSQKKVP
jgi:hypothetical protein